MSDCKHDVSYSHHLIHAANLELSHWLVACVRRHMLCTRVYFQSANLHVSSRMKAFSTCFTSFSSTYFMFDANQACSLNQAIETPCRNLLINLSALLTQRGQSIGDPPIWLFPSQRPFAHFLRAARQSVQPMASSCVESGASRS